MRAVAIQDKTLIIDDIDSDLLSRGWSLRDRNPRYYAKNTALGSIHRIILTRMLGRPLSSIECVDHINHDCLDNRRSNLRLATFTQNGMNRIINTGKKSSQYKGVHWHKRAKQWEARITIFGNRKHIGYFRTEVGAARAYDENAKANFGDFARVNFR